MTVSIPTLTLFVFIFHGAYGWGTLGHQTVAYIATDLIKNSTRGTTQSLLANTTNDYLAGIATWADSFRNTAAGQFTAPLHYIDAQDNPPEQCGIDYERDCGEEGCIVSAIANYV